MLPLSCNVFTKKPERIGAVDGLLMGNGGARTSPGLGYEADLLSSALAVPAHHQPEGQIVAVLGRWGNSRLGILSDLDLHVLQSGVVHHHKALLAATRMEKHSHERIPGKADQALLGLDILIFIRGTLVLFAPFFDKRSRRAHGKFSCLSANHLFDIMASRLNDSGL